MSKYSMILDRVFARVATESFELEAQRAEAPALMSELLALGREQRSLLVRNATRFHVWPLAEGLVARCRTLWTRDTREAIAQAELALEVAAHIEVSGLRARLLNDLRAEAWACIANCHRILSDFEGAAKGFQTADELLGVGSGDALERARFLDLKSSFMAALRRYDDALALLAQALVQYRVAGDTYLEGRGLLKKAKFLGDNGSPKASISVLGEAIILLEPSGDQEVLFFAKKNLVHYLFEAGQLDEAQALLPEVRTLARRHGSRLERLRLLWSEGLLRLRLGQTELAEEALKQVREGFIAEGIGYDVALVSLDLAMLLLDAGRAAEVRLLATETMPIFASRTVQRELLVAWTLFHRAAEQETVTKTLIREAARRIRSSSSQN